MSRHVVDTGLWASPRLLHGESPSRAAEAEFRLQRGRRQVHELENVCVCVCVCVCVGVKNTPHESMINKYGQTQIDSEEADCMRTDTWSGAAQWRLARSQEKQMTWWSDCGDAHADTLQQKTKQWTIANRSQTFYYFFSSTTRHKA